MPLQMIERQYDCLHMELDVNRGDMLKTPVRCSMRRMKEFCRKFTEKDSK